MDEWIQYQIHISILLNSGYTKQNVDFQDSHH